MRLISDWGISLAVRVPIAGSTVAMGPSLRLGNPPSLHVEEACTSSGMGFRAPGSLKRNFAGVGSELARGKSSVVAVKSGREDLLHGRD